MCSALWLNFVPFLIHACTPLFFLFRLKSHFETNPRDLGNVIGWFCYSIYCRHLLLHFLNLNHWNCIWAALLKHDKVLSKNAPPPHLRDVPDYLIDKTTKEARQMVKLTRDAMGNNNRRRGSKRKSRKGSDPLMAISTGVWRITMGKSVLCYVVTFYSVYVLCIWLSDSNFLQVSKRPHKGFKKEGASNGKNSDRQKHKKAKAFWLVWFFSSSCRAL